MEEKAYRLVEPVAGFDEGDVLDVTARFGDWHVYDVKLEPRSKAGSVELTSERLESVTEPFPA